MKLKFLDYCAMLLMLSAVIYSLAPAASASDTDTLVTISSPAGEWQYPLSAELVFTEAGPPGVCRIEFSGSTVRVSESSCPRNICIATGAVSAPGQWIACLPHQVFIQLSGFDASAGVDASSY